MDTVSKRDSRHGLTARMVGECLAIRFEALPAEIVWMARQCLQDWAAVSLAGFGEPAAGLLLDELVSRGGPDEAIAIGAGRMLPAAAAAEYNGTLAHVLDYDDVNLAITGHATAVVAPALLALGQQRGAHGRELIVALVAGTEMACRVGQLIAPSHYARGFHSTATIGALAAAVACAHLLQLSPAQAEVAVGLAATQCGGLKAMFGSMGKPWHAGLAARNGLVAASLAARGFDGPRDILESPQGFASAFSDSFNLKAAETVPARGWHIRNTLFKFHSSCYGTHACMDGLSRLRTGAGLRAADVAHVRVVGHSSFSSVCNIAAPATANEAKFSLRACAGFALADLPTAALSTFSAEALAHPEVARLMPLVEVDFSDELPMMAGEVTVTLYDGRQLTTFHDAGIPVNDLDAQQARLDRKFQALAEPFAGPGPTRQLHAAIADLDQLDACSLGRALQSCAPTQVLSARTAGGIMMA